MAVIVNTQEAKTQLSHLIKLVNEGEEVIIANRNIPVACLTSYKQPQKRPLGFVKGSLPQTFFDPLNADELEAWGL